MAAEIQISELDKELTRILTEYSDEVCKAVDSCAQKSMKELVKATKKDAPFNKHSHGKHYRDLITSRKEKLGTHRAAYTWYVRAPKFRMAHLLNNGHVIKSKGRIVGKYNGDRHISKHVETIISSYEKEVKEAVRNAGH